MENKTKKILGLDISTTTIGYAYTDHIISSEGYLTKPVKLGMINPCGDDLVEKAVYASREFISIFEENGVPDIIQIEDSLQSYQFLLSSSGRAKTTPQTLSKLSGFNYMCQFFLYRYTKVKPIMINVQSARKKVFGHTFRNYNNKKEAIRDNLMRKYPYIVEFFPKKVKGKNAGDFSEKSLDMCDALVISLVIV